MSIRLQVPALALIPDRSESSVTRHPCKQFVCKRMFTRMLTQTSITKLFTCKDALISLKYGLFLVKEYLFDCIHQLILLSHPLQKILFPVRNIHLLICTTSLSFNKNLLKQTEKGAQETFHVFILLNIKVPKTYHLIITTG